MNPPFLVIRPAQSFWVERGAPRDCSATLQAFRDRCYAGVRWYDAAGGQWTVLEARLRRPPSVLDRILWWRRVPVALDFSARAHADVEEVLARVGEVLRSGNEFCEHLETPATELWAQFTRARTIADVIDVASDRLKLR